MATKLEEIIELVDFVELVQKKTSLKKLKSDQYRGISPFTNEKTPSFFVNSVAKTWYCFSSNTGGGVIDFICRADGVSREEAIAKLAEHVGVEIEDVPNETREIRRALSVALRYYLTYQDTATKYMVSRGIDKGVVKEYELGYAPEDSGEILYELEREGVSKEHAFAAGILYKGENGRLRHRYFNRVMIPIKDEYGKLVSFTGRDTSGTSHAKYLHGSGNALAQKKNILWGLSNARKLISEKDFAVVCEGQVDTMALASYGIPAVSIMGSSMSSTQINLLSRLTRHIYLSFDSDDAGDAALIKSFGLARTYGVDSIVYAVILPKGMDPADYIVRFGPEGFYKLMGDAKSDTSAIVKKLIKGYYKAGISKTALARRVLDSLKYSFHQTFSYRSLDLIERVSQEFGINPKDLQTWVRRNRQEPPQKLTPLRDIMFPAPIYERRILYAILSNPSLVAKLQDLGVTYSDFSSPLVSRVISLIPVGCPPYRVFEILKTDLKEKDYNEIIQFFSTGVPDGENSFETAVEILKLKVLERENAVRTNLLGRPVDHVERDLRPALERILKGEPI